MTSKQALEYLTSKVFTGGNSILEVEAEDCAKIINQDLDKLGSVTNEYKNLAIDYGKLNEKLQDLECAIIIVKDLIERETTSSDVDDIEDEYGDAFGVGYVQGLKKAYWILGDVVRCKNI